MTTSQTAPVARDKGPDDDSRLADLMTESIRMHADSFSDIRAAPTAGLEPELAALRTAADTLVRVAEVDRRLVGFVTARLRPAPTGGIERFDGPVVYVADIAVTAGFRRRGVARLLLADVESWARSRGACAITLSVHHHNEARSLYRATGFAPTWVTYRENLEPGSAVDGAG